MKTNKRKPGAYVWLLPLILIAGLGFWKWQAAQSASMSQPKHHDRYQCPMHPQIVEDHPGDCPICHMHLQKMSDDVDTDEDAGMGQHKILKYRNPMNPMIFSDHAMKDSMGMDYVPVYSDELGQGSDDVPSKAKFTLSPARQQLIGVRTMPVEMKKLTSTLRLPGRVTSGGRILAQLLEIDAGAVRAGMKARLQGPDGQEVDAKVVQVEDGLDSLTHAFGVILQPDATAAWMRQGVYSLVQIDLNKGIHLVVPDEAVLDTGEGQLVFVAGDKGSFEPRQVVLGVAGDDLVEVKKGLKAGEQVVTSANFLIDSESRFRAALKNFDGASHD